jgi:hypothetical protein
MRKTPSTVIVLRLIGTRSTGDRTQVGGDMEAKCAKAAAGVFVAAVVALMIFCFASQFFTPDTIS